jgi:hypothetical protein
MTIKKEDFLKFIAIFCIELIIFLPFYVADVYAAPTINNAQARPSYNSAEITWDTDIESNSLVNYGKDTLIELSKSSSEITTTHNINLSPLTTNTKYYFRVRSCNGSDCSNSVMSDFTTLEAPAPSKITGLRNETVTTNSVELLWDESNSNYFSHYNIYRNNAVIANLTSKSATKYTDTGLTGSTT